MESLSTAMNTVFNIQYMSLCLWNSIINYTNGCYSRYTTMCITFGLIWHLFLHWKQFGMNEDKTFCGCLSFRMDFLNFWTKKFMYSYIYESLSSSTLSARFFFFLSHSSFSLSLLVLFHFRIIFQTFNFPNEEVKPKEDNSVDSKTAMSLGCYCSLAT